MVLGFFNETPALVATCHDFTVLKISTVSTLKLEMQGRIRTKHEAAPFHTSVPSLSDGGLALKYTIKVVHESHPLPEWDESGFTDGLFLKQSRITHHR